MEKRRRYKKIPIREIYKAFDRAIIDMRGMTHIPTMNCIERELKKVKIYYSPFTPKE